MGLLGAYVQLLWPANGGIDHIHYHIGYYSGGCSSLSGYLAIGSSNNMQTPVWTTCATDTGYTGTGTGPCATISPTTPVDVPYWSGGYNGGSPTSTAEITFTGEYNLGISVDFKK